MPSYDGNIICKASRIRPGKLEERFASKAANKNANDQESRGREHAEEELFEWQVPANGGKIAGGGNEGGGKAVGGKNSGGFAAEEEIWKAETVKASPPPSVESDLLDFLGPASTTPTVTTVAGGLDFGWDTDPFAATVPVAAPVRTATPALQQAAAKKIIPTTLGAEAAKQFTL